MVASCEQSVRESLDKRIERYGAYGVFKDRDWTTASVRISKKVILLAETFAGGIEDD